MQLDNLLKVLSSEEESEKYLLSKGILKNYSSCYYCGSSNIGRVRRNSYKCYSCAREWGVRKNSVWRICIYRMASLYWY